LKAIQLKENGISVGETFTGAKFVHIASFDGLSESIGKD